MSLERLIEVAKTLLLIRIDERRSDPLLWEHSERVMRFAQRIAQLPELKSAKVDPLVISAAALFHDAGWAVQFQQGRVDRWQILARPTTEAQRELGAAMLQEHGAHLLPPKTLRAAVDTIHACAERQPDEPEPQIVLEAESLDEIGLPYLLRQHRQHQADGRTLQQLVQGWRVQRDYGYWNLRLTESFRFESTRELARARLESTEQFMSLLEAQLEGVELPAPPG